MRKVLIATLNKSASETIRQCFDKSFQTGVVSSYEKSLDAFSKEQYEFLFVDIELILPQNNEETYKNKFHPYWRLSPDIEIIVLTSSDKTREAVQAVKAGASNYLTYPIDPAEVKYIIDSINKDIRLFAELKYLRGRFWRQDSLTFLQTKSQKMKQVLEKVRAVSQTDTTVLLTGETGTGKGVVANLIHRHSMRNEKQYIPVHCGAIPDTLLESELFGFEKGAFTGAVNKRLGKFEIAHGGTIFLDEIGTISPAMQIKLLQVLQEKYFYRVGGESTIHVDVRFIVATNMDLMKMCDEGNFRKDLYYRLNVFPIELPPLRERKEDIPHLVEIFINRLNKFSTKNILDVDPEVMKALKIYNWPGNIRELENLIERAYVLENTPVLTFRSFPIELFENQISDEFRLLDTSSTLKQVKQQAINRIEYQYLKDLLLKNQGKIGKTAQDAGIGVRQLHKLMNKHGLQKEEFKKASSSPNKKEL